MTQCDGRKLSFVECIDILGQVRASYAAVLGKSPIELHHYELARHGEGSQVCIVPDMRRVGRAFSERPPKRFEINGFFDESNAPVSREQIVFLPGFAQRQGARAEYMAIRRQSQEALLRHPQK
jgi:hypothetical protein